MGRNPVDTAIAIADAATWYLALTLVAVILLTSLRNPAAGYDADATSSATTMTVMRGKQFGMDRPCEEIYVVGEGETLHTISDKCGDPYIVEQNPHIHDPDDVFPGLVIKITPSDPKRRYLYQSSNYNRNGYSGDNVIDHRETRHGYGWERNIRNSNDHGNSWRRFRSQRCATSAYRYSHHQI